MTVKSQNIPSNLPSLIFFGGALSAFPYFREYNIVMRLGLFISGFFPYAMLLFFPLQWSYHLTLTLSLNLLMAFWHLKSHSAEKYNLDLKGWFVGLKAIPILLILSLPFSILLAGVDKLTADWLWSSFIEINFSKQDIFKGLGTSIAEFSILIFLVSISIGRVPVKLNIRSSINIILMAIICFLSVSHLYRFFIDIPSRQTIEAGIFSDFVNTIRSEWISLVCYVSISLLIFQTKMRSLSLKKHRMFFIKGIFSLCLCLAGMSMHSGMAANYFLYLGREKEKTGDISKAIYWYEKTLAIVETEKLKSYLQFRVGLLQRKEGQLTKARSSFAKVILKYNRNKEIVQKARRFQKNLEAADENQLKRMVIPGVEARTEYKSAYCVPNSLGLVLGYWDDKVGAKEIGAQITKLDEGSYVTDEAYFSESRGFVHYVLPLRTREEVKKLLDAEIPVLAFIPGHVLALLGYDEILETYITYDVATFEIWDERDWTDFESEWAQNYNTIGIVVPPQKEKLVKGLFGDSTLGLSEAYMQYLISLISTEPHKNLKNIKASANKGLFFADWEYTYKTEKPVDNPPQDSLVFNFVSKPGIYSETALYYLQTLYITGQFNQIVKFMDFYRTRQMPTAAMLSILAGAYNKLGDPNSARNLLLSSGNALELNLPAIEFLLNQDLIQNSPMLSLSLVNKIFLANPHELNNGKNAELAYQLWRKYSPVTRENSSQHIETIFQYLSNFDPFSEIAVADLEAAIGYLNFYDEDKRNKELWGDRLKMFKANVNSLKVADS